MLERTSPDRACSSSLKIISCDARENVTLQRLQPESTGRWTRTHTDVHRKKPRSSSERGWTTANHNIQYYSYVAIQDSKDRWPRSSITIQYMSPADFVGALHLTYKMIQPWGTGNLGIYLGSTVDAKKSSTGWVGVLVPGTYS